MMNERDGHPRPGVSGLSVGLAIIGTLVAVVGVAVYVDYSRREYRRRNDGQGRIQLYREFHSLKEVLISMEQANELPPTSLSAILASKHVTPASLALQFAHFQLQKGVDYWGHPFRYVVSETAIGADIHIRSDGPNGVDDHGSVDDVRITFEFTVRERQLKAWVKHEFDALKGLLVQYEKAHELPPDNLKTLLESKYQYVTPYGWVYDFRMFRSGNDSWRHPIRYRVTTTNGGAEVRLQSDGPNGIDDHGAEDDIVMTCKLRLNESQRPSLGERREEPGR